MAALVGDLTVFNVDGDRRQRAGSGTVDDRTGERVEPAAMTRADGLLASNASKRAALMGADSRVADNFADFGLRYQERSALCFGQSCSADRYIADGSDRLTGGGSV